MLIDRLISFLQTSSERKRLLLIVVIAFLLRLYAVVMAQGIAYDSAAYGFMARDFMKGNMEKALAIPGHPLYPLLISLFSKDSALVELTGRLLSLFFGVLTLFPLYFLIKEAVGQKEAFFSVLFYTFHPYLVTYSGMMLTEATYWGFLVLSVFFFWTGLKMEDIGRIALSGIFLGLSYLTRPEGMGYIAVYLAWILKEAFVKRRWLKPVISMVVLISGLIILGLPYLIYIKKETGQWLISKKAINVQSYLFQGNISEIESLQKSPTTQRDSKLTWMAQNIIRHIPSVVYHYLRAYHFSLWFILLLGLIRVRRKRIEYEFFLASLVIFHLLSLASFLPSTIRFSVPVIPLSLFWAGAGILEIGRYFEGIKKIKPRDALFWLIAIIILIQLPQSLKPERGHRAFQKEVGLWLKQHTPGDAIIMSNSPQEIFYADREFVMLPRESDPQSDPMRSFEKIIDYAKSKGVHYLLVNKNTHEVNPGLMNILASEEVDIRKRLNVIFRRETPLITIYEVRH